jgi:6-phosphogluconolactonase
VLIYKVNPSTGEITANDPAFVKLPNRSGPRHIHIAPDNTVAFVNGEIDMSVHVIKMDVTGNKFELVQSLSTLPKGEKVVPQFSTAETRIHPNGKFVYVSNRGHNTLAAFSYDAKAMKLTPVGHIKGDIKTPRNFNITPDGKWMLIASQDGGKVVVYSIDEKTGLAKETEHSVKVDKPVCVKFLAKP